MSGIRNKSIAFYSVLEELKLLHDAKGNAYEGGSEVYSNYRRISPWVPALINHPELSSAIYALMRAEEKVFRVRNVLCGADPSKETVEDTLKDIAIISLISLVLYREKHNDNS